MSFIGFRAVFSPFWPAYIAFLKIKEVFAIMQYLLFLVLTGLVWNRTSAVVSTTTTVAPTTTDAPTTTEEPASSVSTTTTAAPVTDWKEEPLTGQSVTLLADFKAIVNSTTTAYKIPGHIVSANIDDYSGDDSTALDGKLNPTTTAAAGRYAHARTHHKAPALTAADLVYDVDGSGVLDAADTALLTTLVDARASPVATSFFSKEGCNVGLTTVLSTTPSMYDLYSNVDVYYLIYPAITADDLLTGTYFTTSNTSKRSLIQAELTKPDIMTNGIYTKTPFDGYQIKFKPGTHLQYKFWQIQVLTPVDTELPLVTTYLSGTGTNGLTDTTLYTIAGVPITTGFRDAEYWKLLHVQNLTLSSCGSDDNPAVTAAVWVGVGLAGAVLVFFVGVIVYFHKQKGYQRLPTA